MWILVTNRRVLGLSAAGDLQIEIAQAQFAEFSLRRPTMLGDIALTVRTATGLTVAFGDPSKGDILMLTRALKKFPTAQADVAPVEPAPSDLDREWPPTDPDPAASAALGFEHARVHPVPPENGGGAHGGVGCAHHEGQATGIPDR